MAASVTTNQLILEAYKTIALITSNETLTSEQQARGLYLLNEEIARLNQSGNSISFYSELDFNLVAGKPSYSIGPAGSDVVANPFTEVEFVSLIYSNVISPLKIITRFEAFSVGRLANTSPCIPDQVWVTHNNTQTILNFYLPPDQPYQVQVRGKEQLSEFALFQNISNVPKTALKYFRYALASELANEYPALVWTPKHQSTLDELYAELTGASEIDLAIRPSPAFTANGNSGGVLTRIYGGA